MSKRGEVESLKDILESADRIQRYVGNSTLAEFMADTQAQDAVVRLLRSCRAMLPSRSKTESGGPELT